MIAMMTISRIGEACDVFVDSDLIPDARGMWCMLQKCLIFCSSSGGGGGGRDGRGRGGDIYV